MQRVIIFGTGMFAQRLACFGFENICDVLYYVDNDSKKQGTEFGGKPVKSPNELLKDKDESFIILIAVANGIEEIRNQLLQMNISASRIYNYDDFVEFLCKTVMPESFLNKMNFSRISYFRGLCERVISEEYNDFDVNSLVRKINGEIDSITQKANDGFWRVTSGDLTFIKYMKELSEAILNQNEKVQLKRKISYLLENAIVESQNKLKIVFFATTPTTWPSLKSVYEACANDKKFVTQLVHIPFYHPGSDNFIDHYYTYKQEMELPIFRHYEYNISEESPDIAIFVSSYEYNTPFQYNIHYVDKIVTRCCYISYGFEGLLQRKYYPKLQMIDKAWKFIFYGDMVKEEVIKDPDIEGNNIVAWGHPRADIYRDYREKKKNISFALKTKINGRKCILWCPHHTEDYGTFLNYYNHILEYFKNNPDVFLILRPHPLMFGMLHNSERMTKARFHDLKNEITSCENVIIDDSSDYMKAFLASDAIITDCTSFRFEYLFTGNPMLLTYKQLYDEKGNEIDSILFKEEFFENCNIAFTENEITDFLDMVKRGKDLKKDKREKLVKKLFTINPEGNGEFIKNKIYEEILAETERNISSFC